ncbi:MAG: hypothetical protein BKP49_04105 [Treponema sp. CETP13]|nr:MAG: hypothetical protein BKP49_04105 [Treponema sp. CETP13]
MESFGNILKEARESKNLSIETVVRETSISKQYIEALENEDIDIFPGHTYVIGFIRTYGDYLDIDSSHLIRLFQAKIIQEAPIPEKLIVKKRQISIKEILLIILGGLAILAGIICLFVFVIFATPKDDGITTVDITNKDPLAIELSSTPLETRLYKGDIIRVPLLSETIDLTVSGTLSVLSLDTPIGVQFIELGEELELDIDGKKGTDIVVFLSDISKTDADRGVEVRMWIANKITEANPSSEVDETEILSETEAAKLTKSDQFVIFTDDRAYPFSLKIIFRGPCLFRSKVDRDDAVENYFTSGSSKTITANNGVKLWMSNSNAVTIQVIADGKYVDLDIGRPGQVSVKEISWIKDSAAVYKLVEYEVD